MGDRQTLPEWTRRKVQEYVEMHDERTMWTNFGLHDVAIWLDEERAAAVERGDIDPPGMDTSRVMATAAHIIDVAQSARLGEPLTCRCGMKFLWGEHLASPSVQWAEHLENQRTL